MAYQRQQLTEEELRERAAAFDERFGSNAFAFLQTPEQTQEYTFSATASDGRDVRQTINASSPEMATLQSWDVIQQHQRNGTQLETARIEWSNEDGPQVSHIYDRAQGFEISKPPGLDLQNNAATSQMQTMDDGIRQQTQPALPAQVPHHEHHQKSPANQQHEEQQKREQSLGFGF